MQERYPEDDTSPHAAEGHAAHWWVAEALSGREHPAGAEAPNGLALDVEMIDCGRTMVADVRGVGGTVRVEERVTIHTVHDDCWGTPDAYVMERDVRRLTVWDYKYGHRYVDAYRNWQLILYAIGILESEGIPQDEWGHYALSLTIVQPRNYHPDGPVRSWSIGGPALVKYVEPLRRAATEASMPGAQLRTGDHCRDCSARHACPALARSAALSVDIAHEQTPMDLTPAAMGRELAYLTAAMARIKARHDALEEQTLAAIRAGQDVPLWKGTYSAGRERWKVPPEQVAILGDMWGVDVRAPLAVLTPAQARKAGLDIAGFTERPTGALRLEPVTDGAVSRAFERGDVE